MVGPGKNGICAGIDNVVMRMVTTFVSNANKYTDKGRVLIGVRRVPQGVRVEVHDTGPGFTKESFLKACGRSVRLATGESATGGEGFGLDIVAELAEDHGYPIEFLQRRSGAGIGFVVPRSIDGRPVMEPGTVCVQTVGWCGPFKVSHPTKTPPVHPWSTSMCDADNRRDPKLGTRRSGISRLL